MVEAKTSKYRARRATDAPFNTQEPQSEGNTVLLKVKRERTNDPLESLELEFDI
jgi:hypothetical protein